MQYKKKNQKKKKKKKKKKIYIYIYIYIYKCVKYDDIFRMLLEKSVAKFQDIKGQNYDCNKFSNNKAIIILRFKNIPIQLWVFCGLYVYAVVINTILLLLIRMGKVSERIVPRLAPVVVAKVINLLSIGFFFFFFFFFFKYDALASFRWKFF